jgi:arginase
LHGLLASTVDVDLILVPYDSGRRGARMGAGPEALVAAGLPAHIERAGHRVACVTVDPPAERWRAEIRTAFDLAAGVADCVRAARAAERFPLVLSGNCNAAIGVVAGLGPGAAVLWCDAHADFNTPETTTGGFLDGMGLATVTGRCWTSMAARVPGFVPVAEPAVWLAGARDLDPPEAAALAESAIRRVPVAAVGPALADAVRRALPPAERLYLHLDLDVLDPTEGHANAYAAQGGVSAAALAALCGALSGQVAATTVASYDPAVDADGRVREAAFRAVTALFSRSVA